jgi:hypothetical protein
MQNLGESNSAPILIRSQSRDEDHIALLKDDGFSQNSHRQHALQDLKRRMSREESDVCNKSRELVHGDCAHCEVSAALGRGDKRLDDLVALRLREVFWSVVLCNEVWGHGIAGESVGTSVPGCTSGSSAINEIAAGIVG